MKQLRVSVCPLCAEYVEVRGGWDGPYYTWACEHEAVTGDQPRTMTVNQFLDPERRELVRSLLCRMEWEKLREAYGYRRESYDEPFDPTLKHPAGLTYTPGDRKARHKFRHQSRHTQFSRALKHLYAGPIKEALEQGSAFLAAAQAEHRDVIIESHATFNRTAYGE